MYRYTYGQVKRLLDEYHELREGVIPHDDQPAEVTGSGGWGPRSPSVAGEWVEDVDQAIARLPHYERRVVETYIDLGSVNLVVVRLGWWRNRVYNLFHRGVGLMADSLNGDPPGTELARHERRQAVERAFWAGVKRTEIPETQKSPHPAE